KRPAFPIVAEHEMSSTGYCIKGRTRTGVRTRDGLAAADPDFLPLGSVVRLSFPDGRPLGVFVIMDTGGAVKGKKIDIYMDSCREAGRWGRKKVLAEVLDLGRELERHESK
ncbi:MAG: 3D domain-containing protein, partial [Gemmatimonadota bacterium]|nr:3D domain-containing protein [Gemmatimonadota bacterium]